jgi:YfiH family protein
MTTIPFLTSPLLSRAGVRHAFFTRAGGVSTGVYATLNGGVGSRDAPAHVEDNRARMAQALGVDASRLLVPYQIHSRDCVAVSAPWNERPRCDALATATPGLALGVTGADCGMLLFADPRAKIVGAAHAGWKGAFDDVLASTVARMEELGASRPDILVALGPTIGPKSYEVGPEFRARFVAASADHARFFTPSSREGHAMFDLPEFLALRAEQSGVGAFENLALDTYADPERFFSYRRATHEKAADYGRLVSAIVPG